MLSILKLFMIENSTNSRIKIYVCTECIKNTIIKEILKYIILLHTFILLV